MKKYCFSLNSAVQPEFQPLFDFLVKNKATALSNQFSSPLDRSSPIGNAAFFFDDPTLSGFLLADKTQKVEEKVLTHALRMALENGHLRLAESLLPEIDPTMQQEIKNALLHELAAAGQPDAVKFLIKQGAEVNAEKGGHPSAIFRAIDENRANVVKILLAAGAKIDLEKL